MDRYLPARGFERMAFITLAVIVLGLKALAIYHFRADSDETQHAHVVWGWVTGQLQYRDFFDNHMPLFQMACAPLMALLGERADILIPLRWAMVPLFLVCVWSVYRLTDILYSRRLAPWVALFAAALSKYFYTSTEFRTDDLWAVFWLLSLVVAVSGSFTARRALAFGLLLGLAFAVSLKTIALVLALGTAAVLALGIAWIRGARPRIAQSVGRVLTIVGGALIAPAAMAGYFASRGAFWNMYYCVILHNVVPGLKRWGQFSLHQWYYPLSLPLLALYAWVIFRQTTDARLAIRRTIIALIPWIFLFLLLSYWPDITREDDLPYIPLTALSLIPLLLAGGVQWSARARRHAWTYGMPVLAVCNIAATWHAQNLREDRLRVTTHHIADVLALTQQGDSVMDDKGDYVFRRRAYYWVLEPITKARVRLGLIHDSIPQRLINAGTKVCYLYCAREGSVAAQFIVNNYMPFDSDALSIGVLGKKIGGGAEGGTFPFDVQVPQFYAVMTEAGTLTGQLDGKPYTGPVWLSAGSHEFLRTAGTGRVAIFQKDAYEKGFVPLFKPSDEVIHALGTPVTERRHGQELQ